jgi:hypothetical protein
MLTLVLLQAVWTPQVHRGRSTAETKGRGDLEEGGEEGREEKEFLESLGCTFLSIILPSFLLWLDGKPYGVVVMVQGDLYPLTCKEKNFINNTLPTS